MNGKELAEILRKLSSEYEVVFTKHAKLRLERRQIEKQAVLDNLQNPESLKLVEQLKTQKTNEAKYKLWFVPFKRIAYVYVIVINHSKRKIFVITAFKVRLDWQKKVEKKWQNLR